MIIFNLIRNIASNLIKKIQKSSKMLMKIKNFRKNNKYWYNRVFLLLKSKKNFGNSVSKDFRIIN